jgi:hypothetical protein
MHSTTHNHHKEPHDAGTGGFVLWIVVYAVFMLGLVALNGGSHVFGFHQPDWAAVATAR